LYGSSSQAPDSDAFHQVFPANDEHEEDWQGLQDAQNHQPVPGKPCRQHLAQLRVVGNIAGSLGIP
jgi:hypothetical protein